MSIHINNLYKSYSKLVVLKGIDYTFKDHTKYIIKGENGAGKSTLIKAILNQIKYDGVIETNDKISYCPDASLMLSFMSLESFIRTFSSLTENVPNLDDEMDKLLEYFDIIKYKKSYLGSLSKGQRQKANIISSLLTPSSFVIMDEPLSGLDTESQKKLVDLIIKDDRAFIIISHETELFKTDKFIYLGIVDGNIKVLS